MSLFGWIRSNVDYGRDLVSSGVEGARSTVKSSLDGAPLASVVIQSVRSAGLPAAVGAYIGAMGAALGTRRRRAYGVIVASSVIGAAIGFTTGMAWGTRRLTGDMAKGARKNIDAVRDAHWLARNPIDYA